MFKLPSSWCYVKFGGLVLFNIGKTPPRSEPNYWGNDIPWVSISDMSNNGYIIKTKEYLSDFAINQKKVKIAPAGTLLMSFKLTIGKVALLEIPASHNEAIISIFPYGDKENIIRDYLIRSCSCSGAKAIRRSFNFVFGILYKACPDNLVTDCSCL